MDYQVTGGPETPRQPSEFFGGDRQNTGVTDKCLFRNANRLRVCTLEPCQQPMYSLGVAQVGVPTEVDGAAIGAGASSGQYEYTTSVVQISTAAGLTTGSTTRPNSVTTSRSITTSRSLTTSVQAPTPPPQSVTTSNEEAIGTPTEEKCLSNDDCDSGLCDIGGFCTKTKSSGLGSGGIAAIVFAGIFVMIVAVGAAFFYVNKKEVPYMVPFKGRV